jgi:hypothetical protein
MISALSWVPRAAAKDVPIISEPTAEEIEEMRAAAGTTFQVTTDRSERVIARPVLGTYTFD